MELKNNLLNRVSRIYLSKYCTGNNKLPIVTGRYHDVRREERCCDKCNDEHLGDEYHVLRQCQNRNINHLRHRHIPKYYRARPSHIEIITFMQSRNVHLSNNFAQFIKGSFLFIFIYLFFFFLGE